MKYQLIKRFNGSFIKYHLNILVKIRYFIHTTLYYIVETKDNARRKWKNNNDFEKGDLYISEDASSDTSSQTKLLYFLPRPHERNYYFFALTNVNLPTLPLTTSTT